MPTLAKDVAVTNPDTHDRVQFHAGDAAVPDWAQRMISNPEAWVGGVAPYPAPAFGADQIARVPKVDAVEDLPDANQFEGCLINVAGSLYYSDGDAWELLAGGGGGGGGAPSGSAGGVLGGTYPNPAFAVDMATQAELNAEATTRGDADTAETSRATTAEGLLIPLAQKGAVSGVCELDADSKIPTSRLPLLAINAVFTVASQAAMLALTAEQGDVAVRSDTSRTYMLSTNSPSTLADWILLPNPTDLVLSVSGKIGAVTLNSDDLTDIDTATSAPTKGQELVHNGTVFVNHTRFIDGTNAARLAYDISTLLPDDLWWANDVNGGTLYRVKAGTPQTWQQLAPGVLETGGRELAYVELTSTVSVVSTSVAVLPSPGPLSAVVVVGTRPIRIFIHAPYCLHSAANIGCPIFLMEGATELGRTSDCSSAVSSGFMQTLSRRLAPSAGSHTYDVKASTASGTHTIYTPNGAPSISIHAIEC